MDVFLQQGKVGSEVCRRRRASGKAAGFISALLIRQTVTRRFMKNLGNALADIAIGQAALVGQQLPRPGNGIAIRVKEILDLLKRVDICFGIKALSGGILSWF